MLLQIKDRKTFRFRKNSKQASKVSLQMLENKKQLNNIYKI